MKIGIITWHRGPNFGSALQALSLCRVLEELGFNAEVIDYVEDSKSIRIKILQVCKKILFHFPGDFKNKYGFNYDRFRNNAIPQSSTIYSYKSLCQKSEEYDVIICGSDQIWAPNLLNTVYMADFAKTGIKKISYAASIGLNDIPDEKVDIYKRYLNDFYSISVREEKGRDLLRDRCGIMAEVVLDPTFLHDCRFYENYETNVDIDEEPYVFCYFLNPNHLYKNNVQKYASDNHLNNIVGVSYNREDNKWMTLKNGIGADHFLWLVHHAEVIFTDSYHGTIFSLLYHKKFCTFERFNSDDPICQNSRIYQLRTYFGLEDSIVDNSEKTLKIVNLDYVMFEKRLDVLREQSVNFLKRSLL